MGFPSSFIFFLHPSILVIFEIILTTLVIGFTSSTSTIRLGAFPLILISTWHIWSTTSTVISNIFWTSIIAGNGLTYCLLYINLALLEKWSFENAGPAPQRGENATFSQEKKKHGNSRARFNFGLNAVLSQRRVGTAYEARNVPPFRKADPTYVPTKRKFLLRNLLSMTICYLIVDASTLAAQPEMNEVYFTPDKIPLLSRITHVTIEEFAIRTISCLTVAINCYCILKFGYYLLACIAVSTGLSEVKAWRPPFGSLSDAYTIRRFWG